MKSSRYTEARTNAILRQAEGGLPVAEPCRRPGMSRAAFCRWRAKVGGMDASMIARMQAIEDENCRQKKVFAELHLQTGECPNFWVTALWSMLPERC